MAVHSWAFEKQCGGTAAAKMRKFLISPWKPKSLPQFGILIELPTQKLILRVCFPFGREPTMEPISSPSTYVLRVMPSNVAAT
jgi:hypothetical protein